MQQQPMAPMPGAAAGGPPPVPITTEQIQKYLDENKQLILSILENQNLGKLQECAQYQAALQKNLLYLAAIADAQPQPPAARPQMVQPGTMPQGGHYISQVPVYGAPRPPTMMPQSTHEQQLYPQQTLPFPGQVSAMRPTIINGTPADTARGAEFQQVADGRGGAKQDMVGMGLEPSGVTGHKDLGGAEADGGSGDGNASDKL